MNRPARVLGLSFALAFLLVADFEASNWKYRRPLTVESGTSLAVLVIERDLYVNSQSDLSDLRVTSGQEEVPYVLEKVTGSHRRTDVASETFNRGVTPTGDLEMTVDVGVGHRHNSIRIQTPRTNFRQKVTVSTSRDGRIWMLVRDDASIFDFSTPERQVSILDVSYPVSSLRYVRLTIHGWKDPEAVTQCWVNLDEDTAPVRDVMASLISNPQQDSQTQSTLYTWDLGSAGIPHNQLSLAIDTPEFQRAAVVESSIDGKEWSGLGQGVLSRFQQWESLTLDFVESNQRYLRLRIYNRDDRQLAVKSAVLSTIRRQVKFRPMTGGSYWLYYGNPDARMPAYDLAELLAHGEPSSQVTVQSGREERNAAFREKPIPAKPWSETHPGILYGVLALAVAGMGTITVLFLKKAALANKE